MYEETEVIDELGLHVTLYASRNNGGTLQERRKANVYIEGFNPCAVSERWYDHINISCVVWEDCGSVRQITWSDWGLRLA